MKRIITLFFFIITYCILTHSDLSLYYAFTGLEVWFNKMIPTLLPFMILSGIMVRMQLTDGFTVFIYPIMKPLFQVSKNVCYAMIMGFLCGFPMGAKTIQDLYSHKMISKREGEFLLAFCNNIGPVYFVGFVLPLLKRHFVLPYLLGMYGIPFVYGLFLRYTKFKDITTSSVSAISTKEAATETQNNTFFKLLTELDNSIISAVQSILSLGGYMVLFNLINILPHIILKQSPIFLAPILEISGGLRLIEDKFPLYVLLILPFGGLSCIAQTYSMIKGTGLSLKKYVIHKLILTAFSFIYYCFLAGISF
ncbi:MAG: hypothetical protein J5988_10880 [Eubacterium sp.]|nr:hypothetical protein [Eubacterium sp.]